MKIRKITDKKSKILIFQGSPRDIDTCPNMESKTSKIVNYITKKWSPFADIEIIDLSVNLNKKPIIQPCKACISTAGGYQCHWKCSCYSKGSKNHPDFMKDYDVYEKLENCDAFLVFSPINWFSLSTQVKALFDRLVCANLTLTVDDAKKLLGEDNLKNSEVTGKFIKSGKYNDMLRNHLEGKVCGFYVHGDDGASDYKNMELPESYSDVLNDPFGLDPKQTILPFIMQMKYSGIFVPDDLIQAFYVNKGVDYYTANIKMDKEKEFFERADKLMDNLLNYFDQKNNKI